MRSTRSVAAVMYCLALASCASGPLKIYEGPPLPDSETALISARSPPNDRMAANVRILSADDRLGGVVPVTSRSIRVLPRGVCVEARATTSTMDSMSADLCFNAYAGNRDEVRAAVSGATSAGVTAGDARGDTQGLLGSQSGPFTVSRLFVMDMSARRIVASASR